MIFSSTSFLFGFLPLVLLAYLVLLGRPAAAGVLAAAVAANPPLLGVFQYAKFVAETLDLALGTGS